MGDPNKNIGGFERPTTRNGSVCATPADAAMIQFLGGNRVEGVTLTRDQTAALERFYGYDFKGTGEEAVTYAKEHRAQAIAAHEAFMADPDVPSWEKCGKQRLKPLSEDDGGALHSFMVTGASRNMFRAAREDGLRVMAFMAKFLESKQDPVKLLAQLLIEAGWDVGDHAEWAFEAEGDAR